MYQLYLNKAGGKKAKVRRCCKNTSIPCYLNLLGNESLDSRFGDRMMSRQLNIKYLVS